MRLLTVLTRHRGIQIVVIITAYLLLANFLPLSAHQGLYTISVVIKSLLIWIMPAIVGAFISYTICSFQNSAAMFILILLLFEGTSNLCSVWYAYACGHVTMAPSITNPPTQEAFTALWSFSCPAWWSADKGVLLGLIIGCIGAFGQNSHVVQAISRAKEIAQRILTSFFSPLIPLFVLGFVAKMHQTRMLHHMCMHYGLLIVWLIVFLTLYITLLFLIGNNWSLKNATTAIKNLLPAGALAFSSSSSLATMPWTIEGTSKNLQQPSFAQAVIPSTTNIQQIGDCIANAFLCFLIYNQFFGHYPDVATWSLFSFVFVLARFTTAAVLGGAIFIMLPIYESYLGFTSEMTGMILAFNVILDPLITSCNVMANGALCQILERLWRSISKTRSA